MVGLTGVGKSTTCNNIVASKYLSKETPSCGKSVKWGMLERPFKTSASGASVTSECKKDEAQVQDRIINIVDTPGFYDTERSPVSSAQEIVKCMYLTAPGPHAILLVLSIGRQTADVINGVKMLKRIFGTSCLKFVMVVFTGADKLKASGETIEGYVEGLDGPTKELLEDCNNRYVAFNNILEPISNENAEQVNQVLMMAEKIVNTNEGMYFSDDLFKRVADIVEEKVKGNAKKIKQLKMDKKQLKKQLEEAITKSEISKNVSKAVKAELEIEIEDLNRRLEVKEKQIKDLQEQVKENEEMNEEIVKGKCMRVQFNSMCVVKSTACVWLI